MLIDERRSGSQSLIGGKSRVCIIAIIMKSFVIKSSSLGSTLLRSSNKKYNMFFDHSGLKVVKDKHK